ncbi:MAG: GNAT family N-acetyltransferase [Oscillospiraceae bacterium]|nr:GNAT family N-acetyltransferase [Oscillospiraceae bacterium]MBQ8624536.1 GNAT family N-acetyltransferase [Oscillospiraceae bacterium]
MIRRIENIERVKLRLRDSHYSRLLLSHIRTYGTEFDFCEIFEIATSKKRIGYIACFNSAMVADIIEGAKVTNACLREIKAFIAFKSPVSIEICPELCTRLGFRNYIKHHRTFFEVIKGEDSFELDPAPKYDYVFSTAFDSSKESYGLWLTDTVRRVNRSLSKVYSYRSSVLTVRCYSSGQAYITDVATPEADRGKGYARKLLQKVAFELDKEGYKTYLAATDETAGFYRSLYFPEKGSDYIYKLKE